MRSIILETATRFLAPLLVLFSMFLLLRGHHEPGGGFAGGLMAATAFALYMFASDASSPRVMPFDAHALIGSGLLVAVATASAGLFVDLPLFTGLWVPPAPGETPHYGTPLLFDIGVYMVVSGVTILILQTVAEE